MPAFLSDPSQETYLLFVVAAVVCTAVWYRTRKRKWAIATGVVWLLLGVAVLVDRLVESPREEAVRHVTEMIAAANARNPDRFVAVMAEAVEYKGEGAAVRIPRESLRRSPFWNVLKQHKVDVTAWDFSRTDVRPVGDDAVEIGFMAKGEAEGRPYPLYFRVMFARQPDGTHKMTRFASFDPLKRENGPATIPYFP